MKKSDLAYIAGFLDGDGSLMLQLKPRKSVKYGFRVRTIICFYQDKRYLHGLIWIKNKLGVGYISKRDDNMRELRLEGHGRVKKILTLLSPFIVFKRQQLKFMLEAFKTLEEELTPKQFLKICKISDKISNINYATTRKIYNYQFVKKYFINKGLIPP